MTAQHQTGFSAFFSAPCRVYRRKSYLLANGITTPKFRQCTHGAVSGTRGTALRATLRLKKKSPLY
jgi:hypothetical protein